MNKIRFLIIFTTIFIIMPTLSFGQDTIIIGENSQKGKIILYSFITEHGGYIGGDIGYTGVFVNGIRLSKTQDEIGIGVGVEYGIAGPLNIPIYLNYRHYFSSKRNSQPFLNFAAGTRLSLLYLEKPCILGLYSTVTTGFRVKAFSFSSGFYVKSIGFDFFFVGFEIKLGCTFNTTKKTNK